MSEPIRIKILFESPKGSSTSSNAIDIGLKGIEQDLSRTTKRIEASMTSMQTRIATKLAAISKLGGGNLLAASGLGVQAGRAGTAQIDDITAKLERMGVRGSKALSNLADGGNRGGLSLANVARGLTAIASSVYLIEKAARALKAAFFDPFRDFAAYVLESTDIQRRFSSSITSVAGSAARARAITANLVSLSRGVPQTSADILQSSLPAAFIPGLSGRIGIGSTRSAAATLNDFALLTQKASVFSPEQGSQGASIAIREFLSGQSQSTARRLNVQPQAIADTINKRLSEVLANPQLGLQAFKKFTDIYAGPEVLREQEALYSNAQSKLIDALRQGAAQIGNAGVYDEITDRIRGLTSGLLDSFDPATNPKFRDQANRISRSITHGLDQILNAGAALINRASGSTSPIEGLSEGITRVFEAASRATDVLPQLAELLGMAGAGALEIGKRLASLAQHGFSTNVSVGPLSVPVGIGNAGELEKARRELAWAEQQIIVLRRDEADRLARVAAGDQSPYTRDSRNAAALRVSEQGLLDLRAKVKSLQGGADPLDLAIREITNGFSSAALAKPYETQRRIQSLIDRFSSGLSGRAAVTSIIDPLTKAADGFQLESGFTLSLERSRAIADQLKDLLREGGGIRYGGEFGFKGLLASAQRDLDVARRARLLPAEVQIPLPNAQYAVDPRRFLAGPTIRSAGDVLADAIGPSKAERYFGENIEDKKAALAAVQGLPQRLARELQAIAGNLASQFDQLPASVAVNLGDALKRDVNGLADQISDALNLPNDIRDKLRHAVTDGPGELLRLIDANTYKAKQRAAELNIPGALPDSADELLRGGVRTPFGETRALNRLRENRINELRGRYDRLSGQLKADPGNTDLATDRGFAADELKELQRQLADTKYGIEDLRSSLEDFGLSVRSSLETNVGGAFADIILGSGNAAEAVRGFARDVVQSFSQLASRNLVAGLFGDLLTPGYSSGGNAGLIGSLFSGIKGHADGGIVGRKSLSWVAEEGPEAVVPLKGGAIPVALLGRGGGGDDAKVFIVVDSLESAFAKGLNKNRDTVVDLVGRQLMKGGRLSKIRS